MNFIAASMGSYPRIGDAPGQQRLLEVAASPGRLELEAGRLDEIQQEVIRDVLAEQAKAGLDALSDGQVRWADPVSHLMGKLANVTPGALLRYFDTPLHFRRPVVSGPIAMRDSSLAADEVKWTVAVSARPVAVTLPGPLTLSRLAILRGPSYASPDALMDALVPLLADEVARLAAAGAWAIVIEEPWLLREPDAFPRLNDALEVIAARRGASRLWVFPSFGDAGALYDRLQALPVDGIVLDLTRGTGAAEAVTSAGSRLAILLGIADVRTTELETPGQLAKTAAALLRNVRAPLAGLVPSGGLEALPRDRAFAKCRVLAKARDLLSGKGRGRKRPGPRGAGR
ncbi:MAG: hypothetical protein AAB152_01475 [Candidatus Coatesbacteria bacterium]